MSKFKIDDRVKFHMEGHPEEDDIGTVCIGDYAVGENYTWVEWDSSDCSLYAHKDYLTLIGSSHKQELPLSFKIDVQAYADENNISLEQAHNEIQPWLFAQGFSWGDGDTNTITEPRANYLYKEKFITWGNFDATFDEAEYKQIFLSRNVSVSLSMKEEEEIVEIMGKKYRKSDVENALKNLEEKE